LSSIFKICWATSCQKSNLTEIFIS